MSSVALDHVSVEVKNLKRARGFYEAALGAIGMRVNMDVDSAFGMGADGEKIFWVSKDAHASGHAHYALRVDRPRDVDAFYDAALAAGGEDNGAPGPRPHYGPNYYAAFVKDHEGNNIEVVCYARSPKLAASKNSRSPSRPVRSSRSSAKKRAR